MNSYLFKRLFPLLLIIFVFTELGVRWWPGKPREFVIPPDASWISTNPVYHEQFISFDETTVVHAPAIARRNDGKLIAVWYAGTREGAKDVNIYQTIIDPQDNYSLSPSRPIASRLQTQRDNWRTIRKLGNPIIHSLPDGRLMLVYVSVSFGGWAASSLNIRFSADNGRTWGTAKRLVTSPFLNISTLVKGAPVDFTNGDIGIPTYHEFLGKFAELLILDAQGNVKDKRRISWGRDSIQPVIAVLDSKRAIALLRDSGETNQRIAYSETTDHGNHWTSPRPLNLPNPNAAVALTKDSHETLLAVFNNDSEERYDMSLALSKDQGKNWKVVHSFDKGLPEKGQKFEFSYPYMIHDSQGGFHLVYTWHKKRIKYVHFNQAWLDQWQ